jgi:hypothetical protein
MLWSHYAYRDVPFAANRPWCAAYEGASANSAAFTFSAMRPQLAFTRPGIFPRWGAPAFRTQKELAQRALVSDTFSKGVTKDALGRPYPMAGTANTITDTVTMAGYGILCHGDGYNVLYGDSSVKWYGDPGQQIIWHAQSYDVYGAPYSSDLMFHILANNVFQGTNPAGAPFTNASGVSDANASGWKNSSAKIWHDFDAAAGIDSF